MADEIGRTMRRTMAYYYEDGFVEIAVGALFGLVACAVMLMRAAQTASPGAIVASSLGLVVVVLGGAFAVQRIVQAAKTRVTYPRTGYVSYRHDRPSPSRWLVIAGALLLVVLTFVLPDPFTQMPFAVGALLIVILGALVLRGAPPRLALAGVAGLAGGVAAALLDVPETAGVAVAFGAAGLALVASGLLALAGYLRHAPPPEGGGDE